MSEPEDARQRWDALHAEPRFCPRYPDDGVVRWIMRNLSRDGTRPRVLDLGSGAGRHSVLLAREGFEAHAVDLSTAGVAETRARAAKEGLQVAARVAAIDEIDFPDAFFDGVISYGVLCYAPLEAIEEAVARVARALRTGGRFYCITRSDSDWRQGYGRPVGPCRRRLEGLAETPAPAEEGMDMTLLDEKTVAQVFAPFSRVEIDRRTVSWNGGRFADDDWLVSAEK